MSAAEIAANNRAFESAIATGNVDAIAALLAPFLGLLALALAALYWRQRSGARAAERAPAGRA